MNYPVEYTVIAENEKIYIEGGADYWGLFNYLIGDYLRDAVLSETRSAPRRVLLSRCRTGSRTSRAWGSWV